MAQVLSIVPTAGLDAVLVAVELALEGAPRGSIGAEHVLNVIARLNAAPAPQNAAAALEVATKPLADTQRNDSLRGQDSTEEVEHA
jgi:hypothetical protein